MDDNIRAQEGQMNGQTSGNRRPRRYVAVVGMRASNCGSRERHIFLRFGSCANLSRSKKVLAFIGRYAVPFRGVRRTGIAGIKPQICWLDQGLTTSGPSRDAKRSHAKTSEYLRSQPPWSVLQAAPDRGSGGWMFAAVEQLTRSPACDSGFPARGKWYVLQTRSRQERVVAREVSARGLECYLPLTGAVREYGPVKCRVEIPLFRSYVFVRGPLEGISDPHQRNRMLRVIEVDDQDRLDQQLRNLDRVRQQGLPVRRCPFIPGAASVRVQSGPLTGLQGAVHPSIRQNQLNLQIDVLGQAASIEVDAALLKPIEG